MVQQMPVENKALEIYFLRLRGFYNVNDSQTNRDDGTPFRDRNLEDHRDWFGMREPLQPDLLVPGGPDDSVLETLGWKTKCDSVQNRG